VYPLPIVLPTVQQVPRLWSEGVQCPRWRGDDAGAHWRHEGRVITKRISETVAARARDLKMEFVYQGEAFKMKAVRDIVEKQGVALDEIAMWATMW